MISPNSNEEEADLSETDCSETSSNSSTTSNSSSSSSTSSNDRNEIGGRADNDDDGTSSNESEVAESTVLEPVKILNEYFNLPRDLCGNAAVFNEFFSMETWNSLPRNMQEHLHNFLPKFPENEIYERNVTLSKLFNREIEHFEDSPLDTLQSNLEEGCYRPDIQRLQQNIEKAKRREQRFQESERISRLAVSLMISREKLLRAAYETAPGHMVRADRTINVVPKLVATSAAQRAKKRYFQEISNISEQIGIAGPISDDENYPEGPPAQLSRKQKRHLSGIQGGVTSPGAEPKIVSTLSVKGSNLDHLVGPGGTSALSEDFYRQMLNLHKKRRLEEPEHPELEVSDVSLKDIFARTQMSSGHRRPLPINKLVNSNNNGLLSKKALQKLNANLQDTIKSESQISPLSESTTSPMLLAHNNSSNKKYQQQLIRSQSLLMIGQQQQLPQNIPSQLKHQNKEIPSPQLPNLANSKIATLNQQNSIKSQINTNVHQKLLTFKRSSSNLSSDELDDLDEEEDDIDLDKILMRNSQIPLTSISTSTTNLPVTAALTLSANSMTTTKKSLNNSNYLLKKSNTKIVYKKDENLTIMHSNGSSNSSNCNNELNQLNSFNNNSDSNSKSYNMMNYGRSPIKPATLSDLEGYDMMHLPVVLDDEPDDLLNDTDHMMSINSNNMNSSNNSSNSNNSNINTNSSSLLKTPELMQDTHICFLSLIRDIFCSTVDHRMAMEDLKHKISSWLSNPITPLNDWYHLHDDWLYLLNSAVHFLAGEFLNQPEDYVPYLEYKAHLKIYQWIGAGRDTDQHLLPLCEYWFLRKHEMGVKPPSSQTSNKSGSHKSSICKSESKFMKSSHSFIKDMDDTLAMNRQNNQHDSHERQVSPPPPRCRTQWIVRKAGPAEVYDFREQEKLRYENPHMAFTYRQHNYESVVGPVKGIYTQVPGISKARGHTMLVADRPNFVTILTLVRDATARLPNGEGTRADICELLKSSQYISPKAPDQVLQTIVSGALDRMHTEHDPCVKYDTKRKIWIYLHRNRSEDEFERLHHQFQGMTKHKKISNRKSLTPKSSKMNVVVSSPSSSNTSSDVNSATWSASGLASPSTSTPLSITTSAPATANTIIPITNVTSTKLSLTKTTTTPQLPLIVVSPQSQPPALSSIQGTPSLTSVLSTKTSSTASNSLLQPHLLTQQQSSQFSQLSPPPLINKQQKSIIKPELVPIANKISTKTSSLLSTIEHIDVEASLDATPILIKSNTNVQHKSSSMPNLITDNCQNNSNINTADSICNNKPLVINNINNKNLMSVVQPIKITTTNGIQNVHASNSSSSTNKLIQSNQSILTINQPLNNSQLHGNRKVTGKSMLINTSSGNQAPPLQIVGHQQSQSMQQQSFIIPISQSQQISSQQQIQQNANKFLNRNASLQPPALTLSPKSATSLLQSKNIRVQQQQQAGKSLINPSLIMATNSIQQQQQIKNVQSNSQHTLQQQVVTVASSQKPQIGCQKTNFISTITLPKGQTAASMTPAQQKQFLQNIIAVQQQQQQQQLQKGSKNVIVTTQQQSKTPVLSIASSTTTSTVMSTSAASSTSNIQSVSSNFVNSSQIIQIQQPNMVGNVNSQKVHTISTTNLSPQQQQQILQTLKQQHQIKQQQQSLILKPSTIVTTTTSTPTISQKQQIVDSLKPPPLLSVNSNLISTNPGQKITRLIKTNSPSQQSSQRIQQSQQQQQTPSNVQKMNTAPIMTKVMTNNGSQLISLESLLQKQGLAPGTTLRVTGSKPGQTSLIQLTGSTPGTIGTGSGTQQITQYAVLSQGRNLISVAQSQQQQQRLMTTQANMDANQQNTTLVKNTIVENKNPPTTQTGAIDNNNTQPLQSSQHVQQQPQQQIKIIQMQQSSQSQQQQNQVVQQSQQLLNAKLVGLQSMAGGKLKPGIRMVNATNLNIANIGGKQVIIASKSATPNSAAGNFVIGSHTLGNLISQGNLNIINQPNTSQTQTVMLGGQLVKVQSVNITQQTQQHQQQSQQAQSPQQQQSSPQHVARIISGSGNIGNANTNTMVLATNSNNPIAGKQIKYHGQNITNSGGQQIVLGTPIKGGVKGPTGTITGTGTGQRLVLATQGQGGQLVTQQILLPNIQGSAINLKSLQGLKVIPIQQQGKDRPMFARILTQQPQQQQLQQLQQQQSSPQHHQQHQVQHKINSSTATVVSSSSGTVLNSGAVEENILNETDDKLE